MALQGQLFSQISQNVQRSAAVIWASPFTSVTAFVGHDRAHAPQPSQRFGSITGRANGRWRMFAL